MSTEKKQKDIFLFLGNKLPFVILAVSIILLFTAFLLGYFWGHFKGKMNEKNSAPDQNSSGLVPLPPTPPAIFAYSGKVAAIADKTIQLKTTVTENGREVEKTIKITTSDNTEYSKVDTSKPPLPPGSKEEQANEREKAIQFSEIQNGDRIVAQAGENVKGKEEFTATKIRVLVNGF